MKKEEIERLFEQRFGVPKECDLGTIGSFGVGVQLKKCRDEIMAKKEVAMREAMEKLKVKRERMAAEMCEHVSRQPTSENTDLVNDEPRMTQEEFLLMVEQSMLSDIERGLQSSDEKTVAMYKAMKALLEKRRTMPPVQRERRTR